MGPYNPFTLNCPTQSLYYHNHLFANPNIKVDILLVSGYILQTLVENSWDYGSISDFQLLSNTPCTH